MLRLRTLRVALPLLLAGLLAVPGERVAAAQGGGSGELMLGQAGPFSAAWAWLQRLLPDDWALGLGAPGAESPARGAGNWKPATSGRLSSLVSKEGCRVDPDGRCVALQFALPQEPPACGDSSLSVCQK